MPIRSGQLPLISNFFELINPLLLCFDLVQNLLLLLFLELFYLRVLHFLLRQLQNSFSHLLFLNVSSEKSIVVLLVLYLQLLLCLVQDKLSLQIIVLKPLLTLKEQLFFVCLLFHLSLLLVLQDLFRFLIKHLPSCPGLVSLELSEIMLSPQLFVNPLALNSLLLHLLGKLVLLFPLL